MLSVYNIYIREQQEHGIYYYLRATISRSVSCELGVVIIHLVDHGYVALTFSIYPTHIYIYIYIYIYIHVNCIS